ncbi:ABC transporter permease [Piscinibacter koreensis]|uniref:Transport permease protein n=1 Tax=Piscinibacter koreensis TaxID=2742824 RepID=A0A7Y6TVI7_9BURK|nr:ABC transporter permease [Schlegelella koreensis]NUZ05164.1 ABC transporter permease [Schlegelella koreensis]
MLQFAANLLRYRELVAIMAWKQIIVRYKQSYLGLAWAVLKPLTLMLVFTLLNSFVNIPSAGIPYQVLSFTALIPWIFFQESTSEGVSSIVSNAQLIRKIYFPREVFPLTGVITKLAEFCINVLVLALLMAWFGVMPAATIVWVPLLLVYTIFASLALALAGAALNVFYRDVGTMLPLLLQLMMYASPVIYPLEVVRNKLVGEQVAGEWSDVLYFLYTLNPLAGIIDAFQRTVLKGQAPDIGAIWPGLVLTAILLPVSYALFKRAEQSFADIV